MEPSSRCWAEALWIAPSRVWAAGAQIKGFQQARSPTGHQAEPGQLESPVGAWEHGAANQVKPPPAESAAALGGHAEIEQGVEPNWQVVAAEGAPPPPADLPVDDPAPFNKPAGQAQATRPS